jgi:hypothetical protein
MCYKTQWNGFRPVDAGYAELRTLFDYLKESGIIGPEIASSPAPVEEHCGASTESADTPRNRQTAICVVESDSLLANPEQALKLYCEAIGCVFRPSMLHWDNACEKRKAERHYLVDQGFHDRVLDSTGFGKGEGFQKVS